MNDVHAPTVSSYSERGALSYEDPMNKNFLYGEVTVQFLEQVEFHSGCKEVLDLGCGTGFGFDVLGRTFSQLAMHGTGIEPATGMLEIAREKYKDDSRFSFDEGSFESIPLKDKSVDKIISTLALHWVNSLRVAAEEMYRVVKNDGAVDILMIAKNDGANFKKSIVEAQKKHLTFGQIMKTATLVQRATEKDVMEQFSVFDQEFDIDIKKFNNVVFGSFEDHMIWWKARSSPVIAEVEDKDLFMQDLETELVKINTSEGIPFDIEYLWITMKGKGNDYE